MNLNLKLEEVREEVLNLLGAGVDSEEGEGIGGGQQGGAGAQARNKKSQTPALDRVYDD